MNTERATMDWLLDREPAIARWRIDSAGKLERRMFARLADIPKVEGWRRTELAARRLAARMLPQPVPMPLSEVILLPAPPRYKRDRPRCGAKTRKGTACQAQGLGRGGRCRNHGGMSTGARTPEGLERCRQAALRRWRGTQQASGP